MTPDDASALDHEQSPRPGVAIIGMAGRFPGADDVDSFWKMILEGREGVTRFDLEDLEIDVEGLDDPDLAAKYVCAKGVLNDVDKFDARFFGYLPREAELMDPQHRIFLELCWQALENAGCDPERYPGAVGVYAGCYMDTYLLWNLCSDDAFRSRLVESIQVGSLQTELGNDKDYLATRVAFKLGLTGPAMTLQTACSTSLVAIATACQAIDSYACDVALAGGITIVLPQKKGYFYKEGGMLSPDGVCRTFDADAAGTVFSNGAAVLVLKRLEDAIADDDRIFAVIRGYATNNDGGEKVSYTAPSVEGQAEVITLALESAGVNPRTIGYVEAHGTATPIGDPIEISGLTTAYRRYTDERQFCRIGSLKANLGHLDVASGAIGLVKTALALDSGVIPPQINFTAPNPKIGIAETPFYVDVEGGPWPRGAAPRRAAVSSFGVGGTNAHVVVEEAPPRRRSGRRVDALDAPGGLLTLSAKSGEALQEMALRLAGAIEASPEFDVAAAAFTLQTGRKRFDRRWSAYAPSRAAALEILRKSLAADSPVGAAPRIVFVFPGQGAQHPGMAAGLAAAWPAFRRAYDETLGALALSDSMLADEVQAVTLGAFGDEASWDDAGAALGQTFRAQPAIVAYQIALARALNGIGLSPSAMIGHSIGEFTSAHLAGVMSLEDTMRLVATRGREMQAMPAGAMLAVRAPYEELAPRIPGELSVAAINGPSTTVVSGRMDAIAMFAQELEKTGVGAARLRTSHAFHSDMMAPAADAFAKALAGRSLYEPNMPLISTLDPEAPGTSFADPDYWRRQIVGPVRFADAAARAVGEGPCVMIEIGPGEALAGMMRQVAKGVASASVVSVSPRPGMDGGAATAALLEGFGAMWRAGVEIDWPSLNGRTYTKVPLPTYPFERKSHWIAPSDARVESAPTAGAARDVVAKSAAVAASGAGSLSASVAAAAGKPAADSDIEDLINRQLDIVAAQLEILRGDA